MSGSKVLIKVHADGALLSDAGADTIRAFDALGPDAPISMDDVRDGVRRQSFFGVVMAILAHEARDIADVIRDPTRPKGPGSPTGPSGKARGERPGRAAGRLPN